MNQEIASNQVSNYDTATALLEVADLAARVLGSRDLAEHWLSQPALALDGQRPQDLLTSAPGVAAVRTLLTRMEFGVYT